VQRTAFPALGGPNPLSDESGKFRPNEARDERRRDGMGTGTGGKVATRSRLAIKSCAAPLHR